MRDKLYFKKNFLSINIYPQRSEKNQPIEILLIYKNNLINVSVFNIRMNYFFLFCILTFQIQYNIYVDH
jgi:hypothetical protein